MTLLWFQVIAVINSIYLQRLRKRLKIRPIKSPAQITCHKLGRTFQVATIYALCQRRWPCDRRRLFGKVFVLRPGYIILGRDSCMRRLACGRHQRSSQMGMDITIQRMRRLICRFVMRRRHFGARRTWSWSEDTPSFNSARSTTLSTTTSRYDSALWSPKVQVTENYSELMAALKVLFILMEWTRGLHELKL